VGTQKPKTVKPRKLTKAEIKKFYPKDQDGNPILACGVVTGQAIPRKPVKQKKPKRKR